VWETIEIATRKQIIALAVVLIMVGGVMFGGIGLDEQSGLDEPASRP